MDDLTFVPKKKMESYNAFSTAVKINYSPPSISAPVLISFQNICIAAGQEKGDLWKDSSVCESLSAQTSIHQISVLWQKFSAQT